MKRKLTESRLRNIIREEVRKLNEKVDDEVYDFYADIVKQASEFWNSDINRSKYKISTGNRGTTTVGKFTFTGMAQSHKRYGGKIYINVSTAEEWERAEMGPMYDDLQGYMSVEEGDEPGVALIEDRSHSRSSTYRDIVESVRYRDFEELRKKSIRAAKPYLEIPEISGSREENWRSYVDAYDEY